MFKRKRESPLDLPPIDNAAFREPYAERYSRRHRFALSLAKKALAATLLFGATVSPYLTDIRHNIIESENDKASLSVVYDALNTGNQHRATIFLHGFNTPGAEDIAAKLGPGYQAQPNFDGQIWAVNYNNAPLDADAMANMIQQKIADENITDVSFVLYSEGGVIGTKVVTKLLETSWTNIENVTCLSCASSFDTLTEKTKSEIGIARNLAWIPWIEYSSLFRLGAEAYFYRTDMQHDFANASNGIAARYNRGDMTNNLFLSSQINDMVEANVAGDIENWGQYTKLKPKPNFNYAKINNDIVVDNDAVIREVCPAVQKIGSHCTVRVVLAEHGGYFHPDAIDSYTQVFSEFAEVNARYIDQEKLRTSIAAYDTFQEDTLLLDHSR